MRVFISWSGKLSHQVATLFADWLPGVIQECSNPFISSEVTKGDAWFEAITTNLKENELGVVFITADNMESSWLNFEAGALLSKLDKSGVRPVLVDLKKSDYKGPMSNLQLTELDDKADFLRLMRSINSRCTNPLDEHRLQKSFNNSWTEFAGSVEKLLANQPAPGENVIERSPDDKIDEILNLVRGIASDTTDERRPVNSTSKPKREQRLKQFEAKHGSRTAHNSVHRLSGEVIDFVEGDDGEVHAVMVRLDDGSQLAWAGSEFSIVPF